MKPSEYIAEVRKLDLEQMTGKEVQQVEMVVAFLEGVTIAGARSNEELDEEAEGEFENSLDFPQDTMLSIVEVGTSGGYDIALEGVADTI